MYVPYVCPLCMSLMYFPYVFPLCISLMYYLPFKASYDSSSYRAPLPII